MKEQNTSKQLQENCTHEEINDSDIPELPQEFWENAKPVMPEKKS